MNLLYRIIRCIWKIFLKVFYRVKVINDKYIPEGKSVLVGNHTSLLDGPLVMASTKKELYFLVKKELHEGKLGFIYKRINTIPVNRGGDTTGAKRITNQKLKEGNKVVIFPEGTINKTEDVIMKFKKGTVHFALDNNCPIVPFVIKGKYRLFKKSVTLKYLKPYYLESDNLDIENEKLMNIFRKELERK